MHNRIHYALDGQQYLYDQLIKGARADFIYEYRLATFLIMLACAAVSLWICFRAAPGRNTDDVSTNGKPDRIEIAVLALSAAFLVFLLTLYSSMAFDYMDFSYFGEGAFRSFHEFLMKPHYFSNTHTPGYMLIVMALRSFFGGARAAFIILNALALVCTIIPLYRLFKINLSPLPSVFAVFATLLSPIVVYGFYRITPYILFMCISVFAAYNFMQFMETGNKNCAIRLSGCVFLLPFLHAHAIFPVMIIIVMMPIYIRTDRGQYRSKMWALYLAVLLAALGSLAFNFSVFPAFQNEIIKITNTSTERLNVYYSGSMGVPSFIAFCSTLILNIYTGFFTLHAAPAVVAGILFVSGFAALAVRRRNGMLIAVLGAAAGCVLLLTDVRLYWLLRSYPMSYRHLLLLAPFFIYVLMYALERIGAAVGRLCGASRGFSCAAAAILLCWFAFKLPTTIRSLQKPDMTDAMKYVYENVKSGDAVIPGNIFFDKEFHTYFFNSSGLGFNASLMYNSALFPKNEDYTGFCLWYEITRPDGRKIPSVMLNTAKTNIDSFDEILSTQFIDRFWYMDRDTRFFGVFPDIPDKYAREIQSAARNYRLLKQKHFPGVTVSLYEASHDAGAWKNRFLKIQPGVNDYYFLRGVVPNPQLFAAERLLTDKSELMVPLPRGTRSIRAVIRLSGKGGLQLFMHKPNVMLAPTGVADSGDGFIYDIRISDNTERLHIDMKASGKLYLKEITLSLRD